MVTHHIPDWHAALFEMLRVVRPSGYFIYTDLAVPNWVASFGKRFVKSLGFPTAEELDRFSRENHLIPIHRARSFNRYEAVWQKPAK